MENFSASSLSEDLGIEILERLPVKSLMRFRCVSKSWCNLFKSPNFINGHYRKQRRNGSMLLLMRYYPDPPHQKNKRYQHPCRSKEPDLSFHDPDSPELKEFCPNLSIPKAPPHPDQYYYYNESCLLGPCEGLVCVVLGGNVFICNPALRQFKLLPHCPFTKTANTNPYAYGYFHVVSSRQWGFGTCTDGFKVVQLQSIGSETITSESRARKSLIESYMYDSTTNTWRQINGKGKTFPFCGDPRKVCFLNSDCHWLFESYERDECPSAIITCDISTEIIGHFECPNVLRPRYAGSEFLMVLNECLSMVWYHHQHQPKPYEIWVMKEYGVKDSWTKQYLIEPNIVGFHLLSFWKKDELLQMEKGEEGTLTSCDFGTNHLKGFEIDEVERRLHASGAVIFKESLISVN